MTLQNHCHMKRQLESMQVEFLTWPRWNQPTEVYLSANYN